MKWKWSKKIVLVLVSLFLIIWLNHNQTTNWHFHITSYGVVVVHAHPYKNNPISDTPFQKHQHNPFEFLFLSMVFNSLPLLLTLLILGFLFQFKLRSFVLLSGIGRIQCEFYPINFLRGPPLHAFQ